MSTIPPKIRVLGLSGISNDQYDYTVASYKQAIEQELRTSNCLVDIKSGFSILTQYDTRTCRVIGKKKTLNVFIQADLPEFQDYTSYNPSRSGIYTYPKSLEKTLMESFPEVYFLTGRSTSSVVNAEDRVERIAYKILKRTLMLSKIKSLGYKVVMKVSPLIVSSLALSM